MAKAIMIQGTMSNVGKSALAAALCRIFAQDGYKTVPFKSQNMALNSFVTTEGLEMGRAQVMQAEAAGVEPSVCMNPILLKPTNDTGSQVIVNGEPIGVMSAADYFKYKKKLIPKILEAYHKLEEQADIIVIEGAGSPAEINLKTEDIVNMGLAEMIDAPVLLVGDIDRGGVFAQLVGTIALLEEKERERIRGMIINKFRGDPAILEPGLQMLEEKTNIPVQGVIPYFYLDLEEEDSLTERFSKKEAAGVLDIVVIRLPRISNFTDFMALECVEGIRVRYVSTSETFGNPDAVLIPGSKNTISDLLWMRQNGLETKVIRHGKAGKLVFGICGGYQMLGEEIIDESGVEQKGVIRGMNLLPVRTTYMTEKKRTRVTGTFGKIGGMLSELEGVEIEGYEIHMGTTDLSKTKPLLTLQNMAQQQDTGVQQDSRRHQNGNSSSKMKTDGASVGNVYGSYVHGIFDKPQVTEVLIRALLHQKGLDEHAIQPLDLKEYKEQQYNELAEIVRKNLDMKAIYAILEKRE